MKTKKRMDRAEKLMKQRDFSGAVNVLSAIMEDEPENIKVMLKLGICHLLNRSEENFLLIYEKAERIISSMKEIPENITHLWTQYKGLIAKVTAASLVIGSTVVSTGCDKGSAHKYSGGVYKPTKKENITEAKENNVETEKPKEASTESTEEKEIINTPEMKTISCHRYSGGVFIRDRKSVV